MAKINDFYRNSKPFKELDNAKRKEAKPGDLRAQVLAQEASKRQCQGLQTETAAPTEQMAVEQQQAATGPQTDFSGFFQRLKQEKNQFQAYHAEVACFDQQQAVDTRHHEQQQQLRQVQQQQQQGQVQQQQQQQQGVRLLDQLMNQHSLTGIAPPPQELQTMMSLDRTFQGDASRDGFIRGLDQQGSLFSAVTAGPSSRAGSGLAALERWHLQHLQLLPWDWSIKQRLRLASPAPFAVLEQRQQAGCEADYGVEPAGGQCRDAASSEQVRLAAALVQYQFPWQPLSPGLLAAVRAAGDKEGAPAWIAERVNGWRDALRAAFLSVRAGSCPALYVVGQACRQQFVAVFCCAGVLGSSSSEDGSSGRGLVALVSRTNRPLRDVFAAHGAEGVLAGVLEQQQQQQERPQPTAAFDGQPGSQLLLCGTLQVHGLYAALVSLPWCGPEQPDVPLLLAPVMFKNASLTKLRLELLPDAVLEQQQQPVRAPGAGAGSSADGLQQPQQHPHYTELTAPAGGVISPWAVHRLGQLLLQTQGGAGFDMFLETDASSTSLNVLPGAWQQAAAAQLAAAASGAPAAAAAVAAAATRVAADGPQPGQQQQCWQQQQHGFSGEEQQGWQESLVLLQGRVLKQLRVQEGGGEMAARLA